MRKFQTLIASCLLVVSLDASSKGLNGSLICTIFSMVSMTTGQSIPLNEKDNLLLQFKGKIGTIKSMGRSAKLAYFDKRSTDIVTSYHYMVIDSDIFKKIQINIDVGKSINDLSAFVLDMTGDVTAVGFCNFP